MAKLESFEPSAAFTALSASASDIVNYGNMKGLWCGTGGTVTLVDQAGYTHTDFPLLQGVNPIRPQKMTAIGSASDIYALF